MASNLDSVFEVCQKENINSSMEYSQTVVKC